MATTVFESDRVYFEGDNAGITNAADSTSVTFSRIYDNPVVVSHMATANGGQPVDSAVTNLTGSGCDIYEIEPDHQGHADNTHTYFVAEEGVYEVEEGHRIEAGYHKTQDHVWSGSWDGDNVVEFENDWSSPPVVVATPNTHNNQEFATVAINNVTANQFEIELQHGHSEAVEDIGWIAFPASGAVSMDGVAVEAGRTSGSGVALSQSFSTKPDYVADWNEWRGTHEWVRGATTWNTTELNWYLEHGSEAGDEVYSYIAIEEASFISGFPAGSYQNGRFEYRTSTQSDDSSKGYDGTTQNGGNGWYAGVIDTRGSAYTPYSAETSYTGDIQSSVATSSTAVASVAGSTTGTTTSSTATMTDAVVNTSSISTTEFGTSSTTATASVVLDGMMVTPTEGSADNITTADHTYSVFHREYESDNNAWRGNNGSDSWVEHDPSVPSAPHDPYKVVNVKDADESAGDDDQWHGTYDDGVTLQSYSSGTVWKYTGWYKLYDESGSPQTSLNGEVWHSDSWDSDLTEISMDADNSWHQFEFTVVQTDDEKRRPGFEWGYDYGYQRLELCGLNIEPVGKIQSRDVVSYSNTSSSSGGMTSASASSFGGGVSFASSQKATTLSTANSFEAGVSSNSTASAGKETCGTSPATATAQTDVRGSGVVSSTSQTPVSGYVTADSVGGRTVSSEKTPVMGSVGTSSVILGSVVESFSSPVDAVTDTVSSGGLTVDSATSPLTSRSSLEIVSSVQSSTKTPIQADGIRTISAGGIVTSISDTRDVITSTSSVSISAKNAVLANPSVSVPVASTVVIGDRPTVSVKATGVFESLSKVVDGSITGSETTVRTPTTELVGSSLKASVATSQRVASVTTSSSGGSTVGVTTDVTASSESSSIGVTSPSSVTVSPSNSPSRAIADSGSVTASSVTAFTASTFKASSGGIPAHASALVATAEIETSTTTSQSPSGSFVTGFGSGTTEATATIWSEEQALTLPTVAEGQTSVTVNAEPSPMDSLGNTTWPKTATKSNPETQTTKTIVIPASVFSSAGDGGVATTTLDALESPSVTRADVVGDSAEIESLLPISDVETFTEGIAGSPTKTSVTSNNGTVTSSVLGVGNVVTYLSDILTGDGPTIINPGLKEYVETSIVVDDYTETSVVVDNYTETSIVVDDYTTDFVLE